ncbi:MAG: gluconate 2-dehydrogenase subunit 3 family protein [Flavobacteriaceae bacterium]|nr:gluconate 2-dehydrogenase subunit 3 family protein [Flavobacteriaceae bacterium]
MKRRQALKLTSIAVGGSIVGAELFLAGCKNNTLDSVLFSEEVLALLDEIGETILPETERSPGAKAAKIGLFMQQMVTDCYAEEEQQIFMKGIHTLNNTSIDKYSRGFLELNSKEKLDLLLRYDEEAKKRGAEEAPHFFTLMKQLTILGYFTSEPGATQALRYIPTPGKFVGCLPYKKGDRAWA